MMRPVQMGKPESVPLWKEVELPHCYNAYDVVDPEIPYYQGPAWYRMNLDIRNPYPGGRTKLVFKGVGQRSEVYVYTSLIAKHIGGYDEWQCDITEAIAKFRLDSVSSSRFGGLIPIAIRCDNSRDTEFIPSDMSDFNLYGGIYRPIYIQYLPQSHISNLNIRTSLDSCRTKGYVDLDFDVVGEMENIEVVLMNAGGNSVDSKGLKSVSEGTHHLELQVHMPYLWSPDSPYLYVLKVGEHYKHIGFRNYEFVKDGPFFLNGQRLVLRGTHRHEDHAGVGAAMSSLQIRHEMEQIKAMGANFIRLGHYQQSSLVLNLCDSLGLLVWEEIPWCRGGLGGRSYRQQAVNMLQSMISQHGHHPSIILWGLGNENDWPGDFEEFIPDSIRNFMSLLNEEAHRLDPTRSTVIRRCDFCSNIVDVYSPSIWAGWYSRRVTDYAEMVKAGHDMVPRFFHAEWGGDSHVGRNSESSTLEMLQTIAGDRNGDWSESYICRLFDWHLKEQDHMPWLTGSAFWTFKDFSTPLRPDNPIPYVNQKGVVQRDGTPKESYYVVQSYWASAPMLHIYGHQWPIRWGKENDLHEVLVYSNCAEVELWLNGHSCGRRLRNNDDFPAAGLHWSIPFHSGTNTLKARAITSDGEILADSISFDYQIEQWGNPTQLFVGVTQLKDKRWRLDVLVADDKGIPCLDDKSFVEFGCSIPNLEFGRLGTFSGSRRIQTSNGRAQLILPPDAAGGAVTVTIPSLSLMRTVLLE